MRPTLFYAALAAALAAMAAPGIAGEEVYFKMTLTDASIATYPPSAGKSEQIEIQSFSWGPRQSTSAIELEPARITSYQISGSGDSAGGGANDIRMEDTAGKAKARRGTRTVDANEKITIHGGRSEGDPDRPIIIGSLPNPPAAPGQYNPKELTVSKSNDRGSGAAAREHDKRTTWVERSAPAANGSVWIRVSQPWAACRAGARYPAIEIGDGKASYRLSDVVVTRCAADGASLNYAKVTVRGWDPEKKER